jgi:hypothetical protein
VCIASTFIPRHAPTPPPASGESRTWPKRALTVGLSTLQCSVARLILAMGGVRRVTVVTSRWHVRAPYFFSPYRRFGLDVRSAG